MLKILYLEQGKLRRAVHGLNGENTTPSFLPRNYGRYCLPIKKSTDNPVLLCIRLSAGLLQEGGGRRSKSPAPASGLLSSSTEVSNRTYLTRQKEGQHGGFPKYVQTSMLVVERRQEN